jgi:NDP-sugar pyrophosphorylase family protein
MNLYITLNDACKLPLNEEDFLTPETIAIAGKELIHYWLEWAHAKGYEQLVITSECRSINNEIIGNLQSLHDVEIVYVHPSDASDKVDDEENHIGIGIFLDSGEYKTFTNLDEMLILEQELIHNPLQYGTSAGYGKSSQIQIGKNVYIHRSVKLSGAVVIGNNCIIEKGVEIEDSVINNGCLIKRGSIIKHSHIGKGIDFLTNMYLKDKALFAESIYDIVKKVSIRHKGICAKN